MIVQRGRLTDGFGINYLLFVFVLLFILSLYLGIF